MTFHMKREDIHVQALTRMTVGLFGALLLMFALGTDARAEASSSNPVVIELFTSQGCPGCPPADALLKRMRERDGILTLSWPIDYWDRLGWEDTLATPDSAVRQAAYNKRLGVAGVFTPEMIIDGKDWSKGNDLEMLETRLSEASEAKSDKIAVSLQHDGNTSVSAKVSGATSDAVYQVRIVWYQSDVTVDISSGVNEGRSLHYTNVVRASRLLGEWSGGSDMSFAAELPDGTASDADHVAILVHEKYGHGPIAAATSIALD